MTTTTKKRMSWSWVHIAFVGIDIRRYFWAQNIGHIHIDILLQRCFA